MMITDSTTQPAPAKIAYSTMPDRPNSTNPLVAPPDFALLVVVVVAAAAVVVVVSALGVSIGDCVIAVVDVAAGSAVDAARVSVTVTSPVVASIRIRFTTVKPGNACNDEIDVKLYYNNKNKQKKKKD